MEDHRRTRDQGRNLRVVANIGALEIHRFAYLLKIALVACQQAIDYHHLPRTLAQQAAHNCRADESGPSGDYIVTVHES